MKILQELFFLILEILAAFFSVAAVVIFLSIIAPLAFSLFLFAGFLVLSPFIIAIWLLSLNNPFYSVIGGIIFIGYLAYLVFKIGESSGEIEDDDV